VKKKVRKKKVKNYRKTRKGRNMEKSKERNNARKKD